MGAFTKNVDLQKFAVNDHVNAEVNYFMGAFTMTLIRTDLPKGTPVRLRRTTTKVMSAIDPMHQNEASVRKHYVANVTQEILDMAVTKALPKLMAKV